MSDETSREDVISKYKMLAGVQGFLGVGLLICGILGTQFDKESEEENFGPPYFLGGYLVGIMNLFAAMLATCVIMKGGDSDMSETKKREVGCAMHGHYTLAMFSVMTCFIGLIFAGVFGTKYGDDNGDKVSDTEKKNRQVAYAVIAGCVASLLATLFSMYLVCTFGKLFGVTIQRGHRGRMVVMLDSNTVRNQNTGGFSNSNTFGAQNSAQMEELRTQNLLLQQQISLQQQQLLMQQQQQGFSGGSNLPPPPSYDSVLSDPTYPPPNPTFPSAPYK